jgi:3-methyladenine DNA glycosylase/8-oxoguanine DNA glycosylase
MQQPNNSFGHILSIITEELEIENPDKEKIIREINEQIYLEGNGYSRIRNLRDEILPNNRVYRGICNYILSQQISKEKKEKIITRIDEGIGGMIIEDKILRNCINRNEI